MSGIHAQVRQAQFWGRYSGVLRATAIVVAMVLLEGCAGYVPGRQSYWDAKIKEMCEKDGRVLILEKVVLTAREANLLPRLDGKIDLRVGARESAGDPVYLEEHVTTLSDGSPRVTREELTAIRRSDRKTVARWVEYSRVGGDVPTGIFHDSSYRCPDPKVRLSQLQPLFVIRGE